MNQEELIKEFLRITSEYECHSGELYWNKDLEFWIVCSDLFAWALADLEKVTPEDFPEFKKALEDAGGDDGPLLYCCRKRGMRPQGAFYNHFDKENWPLFDACGPERETGIGNPKKPGE